MPAEEYCYIGEIEEWEQYRDDHEADPDNCSPTFSEEELARIFAIKTVDDIKSVELGETWIDDHEICVNVTLNGNIKFSAMWIIKEFYAELVALSKGSDDEEFKASLLDYILSYTYEKDLRHRFGY